mmetsp:Transcript_69013/g.224993  ORF Transcript_69013/g.224993 Transcript_69013/m.224993 type:complete len:597 (-) Transcript_69013:110-1900(-)
MQTREEHTRIADSVDASLYPVAVLIDELRNDDVQLRLNAIKSLGTIATALGQERTREELLPFLQEIIDDDDEVLIALAEQLRQGLEWVGGPQYAYALIGPLEELCNVEEITVRESATESLKILAGHMSSEHISRHFCALISRLATHDWYTSRISVSNLFACALPKVSDTKQEDLLKAYCRLCSDDTPMVRRQAANVLGSVAEVLDDEEMLDELLQAFEKLSQDEQDSVRILAVKNVVALGKLRSASDWHARILPVLKSCAEDKSWRVRYMMADNVKQLCDVFQAKAATAVVPFYLRLLSDQEVEVRMIAAARLAAAAAVNPTKEFLDTLLPSMEKLTMPQEHSQHVRASLAGSVLSLAPIFGTKLTVDHLINVFLLLMRDDTPEVRLKLISTLGELSSVVGIDVLSQSLLPSIKDLGKDRQWRIRLAVIECMPVLAQYLGEVAFTKELSHLFGVWLVDPVFSVRDAAAANFKRLAEVLGQPWSEAHIVPQLQALLTNKNYLYRISSMLCAGTLAEVVSPPFLEKHHVPMVVKMADDPVPNVRVNVAKTMQVVLRHMPGSSAGKDTLMPALRRLVADSDPDVRFFAQRALDESERAA